MTSTATETETFSRGEAVMRLVSTHGATGLCAQSVLAHAKLDGHSPHVNGDTTWRVTHLGNDLYTITPADLLDDGSFFVTDAMYGEVQDATAKSLATQAVFYPSTDAKDGWDFELAHSDAEAHQIAGEIGPDAVILDL